MWWVFTLTQGSESISITYKGIPPETWLDDLKDHFGDYVIIDPPSILEDEE